MGKIKIQPSYLGLHIDAQVGAGGELTSLCRHVPSEAKTARNWTMASAW